MNPTRRTRLLRALDVDVFVPRDVATPLKTGDDAMPSAPPASAVMAPGRRRSQPANAAIAPSPASTPVRAPEFLAPSASIVAVSATAQGMPAYEAPADWPGLADAVAGCQRCKLCRTRTKTVFGIGPVDAPLLIVGEGPGADEDAQGEPFVGRAGKLLDEMLKSIGRSRGANTYIANVVKCRPPGNRDPEADEVHACRPYLDRQIELIRPKLIVALGRIAAQRLLGSDAPLSKLRGPVHEYGPTNTPVMITYHPAYLLRSPGEKAKSWADLKRVHRFLAGA